MLKISQGGLNRLSNWPYQIIQVTGDQSAYRLEYDEDGSNIFLMPLKKVGEKIELSIRNNAGLTQDLELEVAPIKGQSIQIESRPRPSDGQSNEELNDVQQILSAMLGARADKFYVQDLHQVGHLDNLEIIQTKLYRWQHLRGGVLIVRNQSQEAQFLGSARLLPQFSRVIASYGTDQWLAAGQVGYVLLVQKVEEQR